MTLIERIDNDLKEAMRQKASLRLGILRMLKSDLKYYLLDKKIPTASDEDVIAVIQRRIKKHKDSIASYEKGGRADLVEKEKAEMSVLAAYLPEPLSPAELEQLVKSAVAEVGATSRSDMGKVMKVLMPRVAGRADGKTVSELVAAALS